MNITHLQITTADVQSAASFYAHALGFAVQRVHPGAGGTGEGIVVRAGSTSITMLQGRTGPGAHHLAFTVTGHDLDGLRRRVERHVPISEVGGRSVFEGAAHWNSQSVYFGGPDHAVLELIERRELGVSDGGILCLSEVGVPSPDVEALVAELHAVCALDPFGAPSPEFAPVGDHRGLLICVTPDRPWWPEQKEHPHGGAMSITMSTPRGVAELVVAADLGHQITAAAAFADDPRT